MKLTHRSRALAALALFPLLWLGCGGSSSKSVTLAVTPTSASLAVGATRQLAATLTKSALGTASVTSSATWSSSDASIASVSGSGLATAVAAGNATITATIDGTSASAQITVTTASADAGPPDMGPAGAPTLSGVAPPRGLAAGGASVVLTGTHLTGATAVDFGSTAATSFTVDSDTQITAVSPAGTGGVNVTVVTAGGTSNAVAFGYGSAPVVTGIVPAAGVSAGGTTVTLTGSGLTGVTSVTFGTVAATSFSVGSDSQITVVAPAHADGVVAVVVTSPFGASNSVDFMYGEAPTLTSLTPTLGTSAGGTVVTLTGTHLTAATRVSFGATNVTTFTSVNDTQIVLATPAHAAGIVSVTVTTPFGVTSSVQFTYGDPPSLTSASPAFSPLSGGGTIAITGLHLTGATAVSFGTTAAASYTFVSATEIDAVAPPGTSSVDITITTPYGTSNGLPFGYGNAPVAQSLSPTIGLAAGGQSVVIMGSGFTAATSVLFGTTAATSFTVDTTSTPGTQITAVSPALAAGAVQVTITTAFGMSNGLTFTYGAAPTVTTVAPSQGTSAGGTTVVLTGTSLAGATAVHFGTTAATTFKVDSDSQITVSSPVQAAGAVVVSVTTPYGTSSTTPGFTYGDPPVLGTISPSTGPITGGTAVTLTGTALDSVTSVTFGGVAATITSQSSTQIVATSPSVSSPSTVDVTVTSPYGSASELFTYGNAPVLTSLSPDLGLTSGGTTVTLTGTGFTGVTMVTFGSGPVPFTLVGDSQITIASPANTNVGAVDVTVTTAYGTSNARPFTYGIAPSITSIAPTAGASAGGATVTISGAGLGTTPSVAFGATSVAPSSASDASVTVTTPAHAAGAVTVTLTTQYGSATSSFQFDDPPTLDPTVSPASGSSDGGDTVTLTGTNLADTTSVTFGGSQATIVATTATSITLTTPIGSGTVDLVVTTPGGTATLTGAFTYVVLPPTVTSLSPSTGSWMGGTTVVITGTNFLGATSVYFGNNSASFNVDSPTQITATSTDNGRPQFVDVVVTTPGGRSSTGAADQFDYYTPGTITYASVTQNKILVIEGNGLTWVSGAPGSEYLVWYAPSAPTWDTPLVTQVDGAFIQQDWNYWEQYVGSANNVGGNYVWICEAQQTVYDPTHCSNAFLAASN